jgi:hypothetical protein
MYKSYMSAVGMAAILALNVGCISAEDTEELEDALNDGDTQQQIEDGLDDVDQDDINDVVDQVDDIDQDDIDGIADDLDKQGQELAMQLEEKKSSP